MLDESCEDNNGTIASLIKLVIKKGLKMFLASTFGDKYSRQVIARFCFLSQFDCLKKLFETI